MDESTPRPMPAEVLRAYRDPIDLRGLLASVAYSDDGRRDVIGALMRMLVSKHGDVWIVVYGDYGEIEEASASEYVHELIAKHDDWLDDGGERKRRRRRPETEKERIDKAMDLLCGLEEYGGAEGVLRLLAQAMQPRFAWWWSSFEWYSLADVEAWKYVISAVLGPRQSVWLAAQYARSVVLQTRMPQRRVCLDAIEAAEAFARTPWEESIPAGERAAVSASKAIDASAEMFGYGLYYEIRAAANAAYAASHASSARNHSGIAAINAASYAVAAADDAAGVAEDYARLADLTKRLITPSIVTSASGGVRLAGSR